ncbi:MAG: 2-C-methyl-D-erythritol 4-phosphate cytidylyltransferase [Acidobacteriota bacterium]
MSETRPSNPRVIALVPAGGGGLRFGGPVAKQFVVVAGRSLLAWTLSRLITAGVVDIVVALPDGVPMPEDAKLGDGIRTVVGGPTRQDSVANCLAAAPGSDTDLLLVHDGARGAVDPADVRNTIAAVGDSDGAVLGRDLSDTLKRIERGRIRGTLDREGLFRAETPQVFKRGVFSRALDLARRDSVLGTDEAALVERLPGSVVMAVLAKHPNPKLTAPADLPLFEALLGRGIVR